MTMTVVKGVTCPVCGSLCDDIDVTVNNNVIVEVKNACAVGAAKLLDYRNNRNKTPLIRKDGRLVEATIDEAIHRSAEILANAKYPIFYGWSSTSCEAIRKGLELAEEVGGVIDNTATTCHGPSILSIQDVGISSSTLGQLRHRADLIIYWGSDPWSAHPRHIERYTKFSGGRFQESDWSGYVTRTSTLQTEKRRTRVSRLAGVKGEAEVASVEPVPYKLFRKGRKMIVIDVRKTRTAELADYFLQVEAGKDYELLQAFRMLIRDEELEVDRVAGVPVGTLEEIADVMVNCSLGIVFFGMGLTMSSGKHRNVDAALSLVRDLNQRTKFLIMPMRGHFNVNGANTVSTWQTGYPYAVDFSHGYPLYNPGETSVIDILCRGESDAGLVIAADPVSNFPREAVQSLVKNPLIVIEPMVSPTSLMADVVIPSTFVGIECEGTAYRMDHVPLPLKRVVKPSSNLLSDEEVLGRILVEIREMRKRAL